MDVDDKQVQDNEDISLFHSNVFAKATGSKVGATTSDTFDNRKQLMQKRKIIEDYRFSNMGNSYSAVSASPVKNDVPRTPIPPTKPPIN